ncbi:response regulator [bacterium]|nr:response regulator [bacterium]
MDFGLRVNPGVEARKFLESRIEALRASEVQQGLPRLNEDTGLIFLGRYDKLKQDSRFAQTFLSKRVNLRMEETTLGDSLMGAFAVLDSVFRERISENSDPAVRSQVLEEYFRTKLDALEKIFAGDISEFYHCFITIFLRYTYQYDLIQGDKLEEVKKRFEDFLAEEDTLLRFFFYLDEFNRLNIQRVTIDQTKKSSLSPRLDDEIHHIEPSRSLTTQVLICKKLERLARLLVEISADHDPLTGVRRVLDEVYAASGSQNLIKGLLEKFRKYYEFELEALRQALVFKRVLYMNAGAKEARQNRKLWLQELDCKTVEKLVALLEIKEIPGQRLSQEQKAQADLFATLRDKLAALKADESTPPPPGCLPEGDLNILVLRLGNPGMLEEQINLAQKSIEEYRQKNSVDYQNSVVQTYSDNIKRLVQVLYFFIELSFLRKPHLERRAREIFKEIRTHLDEMDKEFSATGEDSPATSPADTTEEALAAAQEEAPAEPGQPADEKIDPASETDPEKRLQLQAAQLKKLPDSAKIKILKDLAFLGSLDSLKHILPLSQYNSEFIRKLARNAVVKTILRTLREDEEKPQLGIQQKKKLVEFVVAVDSSYAYIKDLELGNPKTSQKVLDILIREDKDFTARTLADIIQDSDDHVRATAVKLIADMLKQNETSLLMKLLNDPNARVRANVIESLESSGNRNVLGILMKYKYDKDNRVRGNAIKAIWKFGHREVEDPLRDLMLDGDPETRCTGVWVIGEIGHNEPQLKQLLKIVESDKDDRVLEHLKRARGKIQRREEGVHILVADDDLRFCQDLCRRLKGDGFRASAALNGRAALAYAEKQTPDLVLLDLRMPVMNGLDALKVLRETENTVQTPVIVMSDVNSSVLLKQATRLGANDYLLKPFAYENIKEKIKNFV